MGRTTIWILCTVLSLIGSGCTSSTPTGLEGQEPAPTLSTVSDRAPSSVTTTQPVTTQPATSLFETTDYQLDIVSEGAEPRFLITIEDELNAASRLIFDDSKELIVTVADGSPEPPILTKASTELDTIISSINNESITVRSTVGETNIDEGVGPRWALNALAQNMTSIQGLWIDQTSDAHLSNRSREIQPGLDELATLETLTGFADALALAQIPVPTEELGLGAIWTTTVQSLAGGLPATITSRATVIEIGDGVAVAEVQIEVEYHLGDVQLSNGAATLVAGSTHLTGELSWTNTVPFALYEVQSSSSLTIHFEHAVEGVSQFSQGIERTYSLQLR